MDQNTIQEIGAIWDQLLALDKKLSDFIDATHAVSTSGITENSDGILDIADVIESLDERVTALEEK